MRSIHANVQGHDIKKPFSKCVHSFTKCSGLQKAEQLGPDDVYFSYLPLPHIYEKVNQVIALLNYTFFTLVIMIGSSFPWCKVSKPTLVCLPLASGHKTTELVMVKRMDQGPSTWQQAQNYLHKYIYKFFAQIDMQAVGSREISYGKLSSFGTVHLKSKLIKHPFK